MGKSKLGKHVGYFDQLMASLNKQLMDKPNPNELAITVNKWLLSEIYSTWKRIKEDMESSKKEVVCIKSSTPILDSSFPGESGTPKQGEMPK